MHVPNMEIERWCICILRLSILLLSTIVLFDCGTVIKVWVFYVSILIKYYVTHIILCNIIDRHKIYFISNALVNLRSEIIFIYWLKKHPKKKNKLKNYLLVNIKSKLMLLLYENYILPFPKNIIPVSVDIIWNWTKRHIFVYIYYKKEGIKN